MFARTDRVFCSLLSWLGSQHLDPTGLQFRLRKSTNCPNLASS